MELVRNELRELKLENDGRRQTLAQAQQIESDLSQTHWLLIERAQNQPPPLLLILVFWLNLLFVGLGLYSPSHITAIAAPLVGACLVLELNRPLDGFGQDLQPPPWTALQHLDQ